MSSLNPFSYLPCITYRYLPQALTPYVCTSSNIFTTTYRTLTSPVGSTWTTLRTAMDALVSMPFLSLLLIPTMTSYSTSLNLLFFYLTWSTLVLSHPPLRVELVATFAIRLVFYLAPTTFFLVFDTLLPSAAEGLKAMGSQGLPLKNARRERAFTVAKTVLWSWVNLVLGVAAQGAVEVLFTRILGVRSALRVTTSLPMPWGIFMDLMKGWAFRELFGYILHRWALHDNRSPLAQYHDSWYHSIRAPFPSSATYDHPLAYIVRCVIPTYLPAILFRFHLLTYMLFLILVSLEETFAHSGYSTVPTNFILGGIARRADGHIMSGGEGNFGPWGIMDWACATSIGTDIVDDLRAEADRHDLDGKADAAVQNARKKGAELKGRVRRRREY